MIHNVASFFFVHTVYKKVHTVFSIHFLVGARQYVILGLIRYIAVIPLVDLTSAFLILCKGLSVCSVSWCLFIYVCHRIYKSLDACLFIYQFFLDFYPPVFLLLKLSVLLSVRFYN